MDYSLSTAQFDQLHHHYPFNQFDEKKKAKAMPPGTEKEKAKDEALNIIGMLHKIFNRSHVSRILHLEGEVAIITVEIILLQGREHLVPLRVLGMPQVQLNRWLRQLRIALAPTAGVIATGEVGIDFYFVIAIFEVSWLPSLVSQLLVIVKSSKR